MKDEALSQSRALWNRATLRLDSDETLAQILDRGELRAWRALYRMARDDAEFRARIRRVVETVPVGMPHFWKAALASLGEVIEYDRIPPFDADWV